MSCMGSGNRHRCSNALRELTATLLREAGLTVSTEAQFANSNKRIDVMAADQRHHKYACDLCITHRDMGKHDNYGRRKEVTYGALVAAAHDMELVVLCVDTMGAWGNAATDFFSKFARRRALNKGMPAYKGAISVFTQLSNCVDLGTARTLAQFTAAPAETIAAPATAPIPLANDAGYFS